MNLPYPFPWLINRKDVKSYILRLYIETGHWANGNNIRLVWGRLK